MDVCFMKMLRVWRSLGRGCSEGWACVAAFLCFSDLKV